METETGDLWVFGYGSLMWRPGFAFEEALTAILTGYARRFCLDSVTYRGTPDYPGLVLALAEEPGAECRGVAYRVAADDAPAVRRYLQERELITYSYIERMLPLETTCGRQVSALAYVMDPAHPQFRGGLSLSEQAEVIATAHGPAGSNREYLENTVARLAALDIVDPDLDRLNALVAGYEAPTGPTERGGTP